MLKRLLNALRYRWKRLATSRLRHTLGQQVRALDAGGFVLVSSNCLAGQLYEMAALRKASPTAGLFFSGRAFAQFLDAVASGEDQTWSRLGAERLAMDVVKRCPVLTLGPDSAIVFLHYGDPELAVAKWNSRFPRMSWREKIVIASLRDGLDEAMLADAKQHYRHIFIAGPEPTPPADQVVLDRRILARLSDFLGGVLATRR